MGGVSKLNWDHVHNVLKSASFFDGIPNQTNFNVDLSVESSPVSRAVSIFWEEGLIPK